MGKDIVVPVKKETEAVKIDKDALIASLGKEATPEVIAYIKATSAESLVKQALAGQSMKEYGKRYDSARTEAVHELIKVSGETWYKIYNAKRAVYGLDPVKRS